MQESAECLRDESHGTPGILPPRQLIPSTQMRGGKHVSVASRLGDQNQPAPESGQLTMGTDVDLLDRA